MAASRRDDPFNAAGSSSAIRIRSSRVTPGALRREECGSSRARLGLRRDAFRTRATQADSGGGERIATEARAVIFHCQHKRTPIAGRAYAYVPGLHAWSDAVADGVFYNRLEKEARHRQVEYFFCLLYTSPSPRVRQK